MDNSGDVNNELKGNKVSSDTRLKIDNIESDSDKSYDSEADALRDHWASKDSRLNIANESFKDRSDSDSDSDSDHPYYREPTDTRIKVENDANENSSDESDDSDHFLRLNKSNTVNDNDIELPRRKTRTQTMTTEYNIFDKSDKLLKFDNREVSLFKIHARFMVPNPRKIKRITNIYRAVRLLADDTKISAADRTRLQRKLLIWIMLLEQWPVRMAWLIQIIQDDEQTENLFFKTPDMTLYEIYVKYVEMRVYDTKIIYGPSVLAESYHKVFILDADPEIFDALLQESNLKYEDVGGTVSREKSKLLSYTINLNPALQAIVANIASHREEKGMAQQAVPLKYSNRSISFMNKIEKKQKDKLSSYNMNRLCNWIESLNLSNYENIITNIKTYEIDGKFMETIIQGDKGVNYNILEKIGIVELDQYKLLSAWFNRLKYIYEDEDDDNDQDNSNNIRNPIILHAGTESTSTSPRDNNNTNNYHFQPIAKRRNSILDEDDINKIPEKSLRSLERTTEDKSGKDHIGYTNYAIVLSMLIQYGISAPAVFGLYATWGTGKSFIMSKCISSLKMFWLREKACMHYKTIHGDDNDMKDLKLFEKALEKLLKDDENEIDNIYNWCLLNCPSDAIRFKDDKENRQYIPLKRLHSKYINRQLDIYRNTNFSLLSEVLRFLFSFLLYFYNKLTSCYHKTAFGNLNLEHWWIVHRVLKTAIDNEMNNPWISPRKIEKKLSINVKTTLKYNYNKPYKYVNIDDIEEHNPLRNNQNDDDDNEFQFENIEYYDYEFVWWNAWLYSGSDNLWAGLIQALYETVESRFGPTYCNAQKKANIYKVLILGLIALLLFIGGIIAIAFTSVTSIYDQIVTYIISLILSIGAFSASIFSVGNAVWSYINTPQKLSEKITSEVASANIKAKLGFMATVKDELYRLGKLLSDPSDLPNIWDFLISEWLDSVKPILKKYMMKYFGGTIDRGQRPCKLIIFVDDLDRCQPEKIVEVLQALVLLTENTPFIVFLAIDPRIVVRAVESVNSHFFSDAGISGYEYLDKIVHIPFAIPSLVQSEKSNLVAGYLLKHPKKPNELEFQGHEDRVRIVKFSFDGSQLLSSSNDGTFKVWDAYTGNLDCVFNGSYEPGDIPGGIWDGVIWSPDDSKIIAGTYVDNIESIRMFDSVTGDVMQSTPPLDWINSIALSPDKSKLCVATNTSTDIYVFKGDDLKTKLYDFKGHTSLCNVIRFSSNGSEISSGDDGSIVHVWNVVEGRQVHRLDCHSSCILTLAYHPNGKTLVVGLGYGFQIWDTTSGKKSLSVIIRDDYRMGQLEDWAHNIKSIAFNNDGTMFAAAVGCSININIYKTSTGEHLYKYTEADRPFLTYVSWSPDGKRIAYGDRQGKVYIRRISNDRKIRDSQ